MGNKQMVWCWLYMFTRSKGAQLCVWMQGGRAGGIRTHVSRREGTRDCGATRSRKSRADPGQLRPPGTGCHFGIMWPHDPNLVL